MCTNSNMGGRVSESVRVWVSVFGKDRVDRLGNRVLELVALGGLHRLLLLLGGLLLLKHAGLLVQNLDLERVLLAGSV